MQFYVRKEAQNDQKLVETSKAFTMFDYLTHFVGLLKILLIKMLKNAKTKIVVVHYSSL